MLTNEITMNKKTVMIVDDETAILETLEGLLSREFRVITAPSTQVALARAKETPPDIFVLDLHMPGEDGLALCKFVRKEPKLKNIPILMLSGAGDEQRRTECFTWGADDFMAKPFSGSELIARITAKLRWQRHPADEGGGETAVCGNLTINYRKGETTVNGKRIDLTTFEMKLLSFFIQAKDQILSRQQILDEVWAGHKVIGRTVDTHVCVLRNKLADFDHAIQTVHRTGYILRSKKAFL